MKHQMKISAIGLAVCAAGMFGMASLSHADAQYTTDVANCKSGQTYEDRATCMKEAGASQVERHRSGLSDPSSSSSNAMARCDALPAAQRNDCMAQMSGQGTTTVQGSVQGGGVLRETTIPVPAGTPGATTTAPPGAYSQPAAPLAPPPVAPAPYGNMR
jgi:hypothetical protein